MVYAAAEGSFGLGVQQYMSALLGMISLSSLSSAMVRPDAAPLPLSMLDARDPFTSANDRICRSAIDVERKTGRIVKMSWRTASRRGVAAYKLPSHLVMAST